MGMSRHAYPALSNAAKLLTYFVAVPLDFTSTASSVRSLSLAEVTQ